MPGSAKAPGTTAALVELHREQSDQVRVLPRLHDTHGRAAACRAHKGRVRAERVEAEVVDGVALKERVRVSADDDVDAAEGFGKAEVFLVALVRH